LFATPSSPVVARSEKFKNTPANPPRPYRAIECEAVGQAVLERMLRKVLDALLPEPLERVQVREERQRAEVRTALAKMARRQGRRR